MKKLLAWTCSLLAVAFTYSAVLAADTVSPAEASQFIGQKATVYGTVASATFASRTKGQPTFLNLDEPYPRQIFTIVIWGSDRRFFNNAPEVLYRGKKVCVTGLVKSFRGKPEITVLLPSQIAQQ